MVVLGPSLSLSILPYDRGPCVAVTAYIMMITMCLCILARLAAKLGRHRNSLLDSTFDLYSKGRERFSPKPCFKANSSPLAPIVQLCRSDSAYRCNNLCKGLFNYVHIRDIPVNKVLRACRILNATIPAWALASIVVLAVQCSSLRDVVLIRYTLCFDLEDFIYLMKESLYNNSTSSQMLQFSHKQVV